MRSLLLVALATLALTACVPNQSPITTLTVVGADVAYHNNVRGYLSQPIQNGTYPGIILIHEWWGLNDHIRDTADSLAQEGYRVLAVDLYNGQVATTADEARALRLAVNDTEAFANMQAAITYLHSKGSERVASWGYCFGGGQSMNLALFDGDIDATIVYYGSVPIDRAAIANVTAPVMLVFGTEDTSTTAASAQKLHSLLLAKDVPATLAVYEGVGHAFANPSNPGHDKEKTQDAWKRTLTFLDTHLRS